MNKKVQMLYVLLYKCDFGYCVMWCYYTQDRATIEYEKMDGCMSGQNFS